MIFSMVHVKVRFGTFEECTTGTDDAGQPYWSLKTVERKAFEVHVRP